jgi:hypothetical protein
VNLSSTKYDLKIRLTISETQLSLAAGKRDNVTKEVKEVKDSYSLTLKLPPGRASICIVILAVLCPHGIFSFE